MAKNENNINISYIDKVRWYAQPHVKEPKSHADPHSPFHAFAPRIVPIPDNHKVLFIRQFGYGDGLISDKKTTHNQWFVPIIGVCGEVVLNLGRV